jgi:hypothetical protein
MSQRNPARCCPRCYPQRSCTNSVNPCILEHKRSGPGYCRWYRLFLRRWRRSAVSASELLNLSASNYVAITHMTTARRTSCSLAVQKSHVFRIVKNRLTRLECQPLPSRSAQGFSERECVRLHRRRRSSGFGGERYVSVTVLGNFGLVIAKGIAFKNFHSASHSKSFGCEPNALPQSKLLI